MKRAVLLFGHADKQSFNSELAAAYERGFRASGGAIERIDLAELSFDPVLRHGYRIEQPLEPDLVRAREAIERADHVVWVFPTYWASPPAIVRGFVDRVFLPGWAFRFEGHALPTGLLAPRSARVVTTMDTPAFWYTGVNHRCLHRSFGSATLAFSGLSPVAFDAIHGVRSLDAAARARRVAKLERVAERDGGSGARLPRPAGAARGRAPSPR